MKYTIDIELTVTRCSDCGRYYGVERYPDSACPYCASREKTEHVEEVQRLQRSNRALRGTLTSRKRK